MNKGRTLSVKEIMKKNLFSLLLWVIVVVCAGSDSNAQATIDDLWNGQAVFVPVSKVHFWKQFDTPLQHGSSIVVHDGVWYLFMRKVIKMGPASDFAKRCGTQDDTVVGVSESHDKGMTWSKPVTVARLGDPYCGASDYAVAQLNGKWHLLTQCFHKDRSWKVCYLSSSKNTPSEPFDLAPFNPSISGKQLWGPICSQSNAGCSPNSVYDEGTAQIIKYENGHYFVSFHGYGTDYIHGFRGMAKTTDFRTWLPTAADLPNAAVFTENDCKGQIPGCIGGGYGHHIQTQNYTYLYIETPTLNLGCTANQRWPFSLYRSTKFKAKTSEWEAWSRNPVLENSIRNPNAWVGGCYMQYSFIFHDGPETYMFVNYLSNMDIGFTYPSMIFKLMPRAGNESKEVRVITDTIDKNLSYAKTFIKTITFDNVYRVLEAGDSGFAGVVGKQQGSNAVTNSVSDQGYLVLSPAIESLPKAKFTANFVLRAFQNDHEALPVATIEVYDKRTGGVLATRIIKGLEALEPDGFAAFPLNFDLSARDSAQVVFKVFVHGNAMIEVDNITLVTESGIQAPDDACANAAGALAGFGPLPL